MMMPLPAPPLDVTEVKVMPNEVSPAGPVTFIAVALLLSTDPEVLLSVPSALVATMPAAPVVKMLTAPRL